MTIDHEESRDRLPLSEQVALAVRAWRRRDGLSQRELARTLAWSQSKVSRLETNAGTMPLDTVREAIERAGFELTVAAAGRSLGVGDWEQTDLEARDRGGRRFPAQLAVYPAPEGPFWWWEQEFVRLSRPLKRQPQWTTVAIDVFGNRINRSADPRPSSTPDPS